MKLQRRCNTLIMLIEKVSTTTKLLSLSLSLALSLTLSLSLSLTHTLCPSSFFSRKLYRSV